MWAKIPRKIFSLHEERMPAVLHIAGSEHAATPSATRLVETGAIHGTHERRFFGGIKSERRIPGCIGTVV
jgi:hypothetical protein